MEMQGSYTIPVPREIVWKALNEPEILKICIPGCESINQSSNNKLEAIVTAKVGPVKARFNGIVEISNIIEPESYTISGEGKGGVAGFAKGSANIKLESTTEGTILKYDVKANVGGKLAQIGSRLIDSTAKKMADQFFLQLTNEIQSKTLNEYSEKEDDFKSISNNNDIKAEANITVNKFIQKKSHVLLLLFKTFINCKMMKSQKPNGSHIEILIRILLHFPN